MNKNKKNLSLLVIVITFVLIFGGALSASGAQNIKVIFNGKEIKLSDSPKVINNVPMVTISALAQIFHVNAIWDEKNKRVLINSPFPSQNNSRNNSGIWICDQEFKTNCSPINSNGKVYLPIESVGKELGTKVKWAGIRHRILISMTGETLVKKLDLIDLQDWNFTDLPNW